MKKLSISGWLIDPTGNITAVIGSRVYNVPSDFPNHDKIKRAIQKGDAGKVLMFIDMGKQLKKASLGRITVEHGTVMYQGQPINHVIVDRIKRFMADKMDFDPLCRFLENLLKNPSKVAVNELYLFLEKNSLPVTPDGHFLAYRRVDKDYLSIHANPDGTKNSNKVGEVVEMDRSLVDPDRDNTCSKGLHFCSLSYLPHYGARSNGNRTMIVKINPADVVSIPSDYDNQKGRCARYEVVAEHEKGDTTCSLSDSAVYSVNETGVTPTGGKYTVKRASNGRFVKKTS